MISLQNKQSSMGDILFLLLGEAIVSLATVGVFLLMNEYDWRVLTGVLVGSLVTVLNFALLTFSVNRALDRIMAERGNGEMTEEEAAAFSAAHTAEVQKSVKASYLVRQLILFGILVIVLIFKAANVLAAVIPLLLFRPILMVRELLRKKKA